MTRTGEDFPVHAQMLLGEVETAIRIGWELLGQICPIWIGCEASGRSGTESARDAERASVIEAVDERTTIARWLLPRFENIHLLPHLGLDRALTEKAVEHAEDGVLQRGLTGLV